MKRLAEPVLAHRLILTPGAMVEDVVKTAMIDDVLEEVVVPTVE